MSGLEVRALDLIARYVQTATSAAAALRDRFHVDDLLAGVASGRIPRSGHVPALGEYEFHGVGCRVRLSAAIEVDFDFGPGGRTDGVDAWRLAKFAEQLDGQGEFSDAGKVQSLLDRLEDNGTLMRVEMSPSPHLYYVKTAGCSSAR